MGRDRDVAAACMILTVAWSILGFAVGFFAQLPAEAGYRDFAVLLPVLIFLPLIRSAARWTALVTGIIGIVALISALSSLITSPAALKFGPAISTFAIKGY